MRAQFAGNDGFEIRLSGNQVKFVRMVLGESQAAFAKRLAISQGMVWRLEQKREQLLTGPEIILISMLADEFAIVIPDAPVVRTEASAAE